MVPRCRNLVGLLLCAVVIACSAGLTAIADDVRPRRFILNEDMIRELDTPDDPAACDPKEVLRDLLRQVGPVARIYPTENYYYFGFHRGGKSYTATLRLPIDSRDRGIVHYTCGETLNAWLDSSSLTLIETELSATDGVLITKIDRFEYSLRIDDAETKFVLNNLDQTPDPSRMGPGEHFAGRSFDESGLTFELIYNKPEKSFYFMLDTRKRVPESFVRLRDRIYVGRRTGFVFFEDTVLNRYLLVAVHAGESDKNTPYDGPFDQLAENFYEELGFWKFVYEAYPDMVGKLTAGGSYIGKKIIFAIAPYRVYTTKEDLRFVDACTKLRQRAKMLTCLTEGRP